MQTQNVSTLKIHKLTKTQYQREKEAGTLDENALYLTPREEIDLSKYATVEQLNTKADSTHTHDDRYYTEEEIDTLLSNKSNASHNHDSSYDSLGAADDALATAKSYTDTKVSSYETKTDASSKLAEAKTYTDTVASGKSDVSHNHNSAYDAIGSSDNALTQAKSYTDTKTASLASTSSVNTSISIHNTSTEAHNDIRALISALTTKLNNFLDVDDATTDQLSEVLTLINNNKGTLESLTTSKINVSAIVDNLTTNSTSKVLSAAQGVVIKDLIDVLKAELDSHTHEIADVAGLQDALAKDWNQTDPTANDYIKNRIVYKDVSGSTLVITGTLTVNDIVEPTTYGVSIVDESFTGFVKDGLYLVTIDGVTEEYYTQTLTEEDLSIHLLASFDFDTTLSTEGFPEDHWLMYMQDGELVLWVCGSYRGKTVSIERVDYDIKKLPTDLLPDSAASKDYVQTWVNTRISNFSITTSGSGAAYTATVDGITSLTVGVSFMMIPHTVSTSNAPTLNVNSLGAITIRRRVSNATKSTAAGYNASWLSADKPIRVEYDGTYWIADLPKPSAADVSGILTVPNGGIGVSSVTANSFLVGDGTSAMVEKTPAEVFNAIMPTVTSSDAGKFLRVSSTGTWAAETVQSAEEVSF